MRRVVLALPVIVACAATQPAARCPAPVQVARLPTPEAPPQGAPVSELLSRVPRGSDVIVRLDVQRLFGTRLGRMAAPFMVWSREYGRLRQACTERPWEVLRSVEGVYREGGAAAALLGPGAEAGHACAPMVLEAPSVERFRARESGGGVSLVLGADAVRTTLASARAGTDSAVEDEAFTGLPPGMASPIAVVLVRGGAYRDAMDFLETMQDEATSREGSARTPVPRLELASRELLRSLRGARIEVGLSPSGDLDLHMSMVFPTADDAQRYVVASRDDMRVRMPEYVTRLALREMRDNPDAPRALRDFTAELTAWFDELAPLQARGPVVEVTLGSSGSTAVSLGVLSAIAIPAFSRYVKRSKTSEAVGNVTRITTALTQTLNDLPPRRRRLAAVPATPAEAPSTAKYSADPARWSTPGWQRLGFAIESGHYYQYRVDVDGRCYVVAASGDLDGDGTRSTFSRRVCPTASGTYEAAPLQIDNEIE